MTGPTNDDENHEPDELKILTNRVEKVNSKEDIFANIGGNIGYLHER
jgi:hypothetical protein